MKINEYYDEFMQDIYARAGAERDFNEATFTERMCDFLVEQAIIENCTYIGYRKQTHGIRVDAWNYNNETEALSLFISDFRFENKLESLVQTDVEKNFKRSEKFFTESIKSKFHGALEESGPGYELAREIHEKAFTISKVQFFLLSNAELSSRVGEIKHSGIEGYRSSYDIWDISRLFRLETSGKVREEIKINFQEIAPKGVQCLPASTGAKVANPTF